MLHIKDIPEENIVFYDIETTSVYAPYCIQKMVGYQKGICGKPQLVDDSNKEEFRELLASPDVLKVSYNGINFDDIVLWRHGYWVNPENRHDLFLAMKTVAPNLPAFGLKFVNWYLSICETTADALHEPEFRLHKWLKDKRLGMESMYRAPMEMLGPYCLHDVSETCNVFRAVWEKVQEPIHWEPYSQLELGMGEPLHEMILLGREYINLEDIEHRIEKCEEEKELWMARVSRWTNGQIQNIASNSQVTDFLHEELKIEFAISEAGHFLWRKSDKLQMLDVEFTKDRQPESGELEDYSLKDRLTIASYEVYDINKVLGYFRSYHRAGVAELRRNGNGSTRKYCKLRVRHITNGLSSRRDRTRHNEKEGIHFEVISIPKSYRLSAARTRRFQSSSKYKINFQNQNKRSKAIQLVPEGWLGFWLDHSQIENVVHIWASEDEERRAAYEADINWSEYVWLCNKIKGTNFNRKELEAIPSPSNPDWSIYKLYKTIKLALNFGMGEDRFAKVSGIALKLARKEFAEVHKACPTIRKLILKIARDLKEGKPIRDPFGHEYYGSVEMAYKVVAYFIQGCAASIAKRVTVDNYATLHSMDSSRIKYSPYIKHPYTGGYQFGVITGSVHDECSGRISLGLPGKMIVGLIKEMIYNMEEKYSPLFGLSTEPGRGLRTKLSLSLTNAADVIELDHRQKDFDERIANIIKHRS